MKIFFPFLGIVLLMAWPLAPLPVPAQTTDDTDTETPPPPGSTVITSEELHSDQNTHISIFTGNVVVLGTNFKMTCQEMTVYFTKDNKVDHIVSTGNVIITQPDRITHCGHAEYFHDTDTFVLTDQPVILDHKNEIHGTRITIERTTQKMTVDGGRSTVILSNDSMGTPPTPPPPSTDDK
jgi:lipopolysaccharide transport protein LptA